MVNPCSRVLRKLSGELTIIQYWDARASPPERPDLRLRLERPDLAGRSAGAAPFAISSDTIEILFLGQQHGQVADLRDMPDLVPRHHPADIEQGGLTAAWIAELAVPLVLAPAVKQVDRPAANAGEVLEGLLQRTLELQVVRWIDGCAHVGCRQPVEVCVPEERVHLGPRIEQVCDQAAEGRKGRPVAVAQAGIVQPVDKVADALRH